MAALTEALVAEPIEPIADVFKPSVYIAGPMRGYPLFNFPAFDAAAEKFSDGWKVINPAQLDRDAGFDEHTPEDQLGPDFMRACMRRDAEALLVVDAVAVLPGWERSRGARWEVETARLLGLDVIHVDNLTELSSMELKRAREYALESAYLDDDTPRTTGGVPA